MISSKTLFLGVYSSNGLIRLLFLPTCYVFLCSPFILLLSRYLHFDQKILEKVPKDWKTPDTWPQIFVAFVTVFLATRIISGVSNSYGSSGKDGGTRRVQLLPFWVPGVRHWGNVVFGGEGWLRGVRESSIMNVVAYNYAGTKHNVVFSESLLDQILGNSDSLDEAELTKWITMRNAFGLPKGSKKLYLQLRPSISKTLDDEVFKGKALKKVITASLRALSESLPDLITFNSSIVDQLQWERVAGLELTDGTEEAEGNLFALLNEFFCNAIIPLITGSQFPESYELLAQDLATSNQSYYALATGFPRFFPLPGLPGATLAKKRLLQHLTKLLHDLTNPPAKRVVEDDESMSGEETDAETPTPLTALNDLFSRHDLPIPTRAAIIFEILHRLVAKAVPLAFWTILHIYRSSSPPSPNANTQTRQDTLLTKIRQETQPWARAVQPPSIHPSFPAPPEITFSSATPLFNHNSLKTLRSCIYEARRLYSSSIETAKITKTIEFTENTAPGVEEKWQLDTRTYLDIGLSQRLINTSPANYISPETYNPSRFSSAIPDPLANSFLDESEEFVRALLIAFVAGVTQLWDITAAPKKNFLEKMQEAQAEAAGQGGKKTEGKERKVGTWKVPKTVEGRSVLVPKGDVRVRIRRREGLEKPSSGGKGR